MPQPGSRPSSLHELRLPFVFVPHGAPLPLEWMAAHPGWVTFLATFTPRGGPWPPEEGAGAQDRPDMPQAMMGDFSSQAAPHEAEPQVPRRMAVPRIVKPAPLRPRLPAHHPPPPTAYIGPQGLLAQTAAVTSATGRATLIQSAQATLDAVAGRTAALANFGNRLDAVADANDLNSQNVQIAQNVDNFGKRIAAWSGPNMTGIGIYDFGGIQIIVNTGQRIPPPYLPIENPMVQNGRILNDNRPR